MPSATDSPESPRNHRRRAGRAVVGLISASAVAVWLVAGLLEGDLLGVGAGMLYALGVSCGGAILLASRWHREDVHLTQQQLRTLWLLITVTVSAAGLGLILTATGSSPQARITLLLGTLTAASLCVYDGACLLGQSKRCDQAGEPEG